MTAVSGAAASPAAGASADRTGGHAVIAGAGLAGSLAALALAQQGWRVTVVERRPDPRTTAAAGGRSVNLGLSARGLAALERVGLRERVLDLSVPMRGRVIHSHGALHSQPYGARPDEILHSLERHELAELLLAEAERTGAVRTIFGAEVGDVDPAGALLVAVEGAPEWLRGDLVIGADGANSGVRRGLERQGRCHTRIDTLPWGYKELAIPVAADGSPRTPLEALHVWPGDGALIVAHPNRDGSLTATVFLPLDSPAAAAAAAGDHAAVGAWLDRAFPDVPELMPDRVAEFCSHPTGHLVTIRADSWAAGRVVLVGDAAHAVYPFYGQGMNSAFEDILVLLDALAAHDVIPEALASFHAGRKPHLDVLADLSEQNFAELRDATASPVFRLRRRIDLTLHRALPGVWLPLYTMVTHRRTPYADAVRRARRQDRVLVAALGAIGAGAIAGICVVVRGRTIDGSERQPPRTRALARGRR